MFVHHMVMEELVYEMVDMIYNVDKVEMGMMLGMMMEGTMM